MTAAARVLIVDDSITMRALFTSALEKDKNIEVLGAARDVIEARELIAELRPNVLTLDVELLAIESTSEEHLASVRFSGMMREQTDQAAQPFDEIWTLTKPVDGPGGWLLAGIRQV